MPAGLGESIVSICITKLEFTTTNLLVKKTVKGNLDIQQTFVSVQEFGLFLEWVHQPVVVVAQLQLQQMWMGSVYHVSSHCFENTTSVR